MSNFGKVLWTIILVLAMQIFGSEIANASGLSLSTKVHAFDSITNHDQVAAYISNLHLQLTSNTKLVVVSGTHGQCPLGTPDKAQGCREIQFLKQDYKLFHVNDNKYVQVVDYHKINNWREFLNSHTSDHIVLAWCYSACWQGTPFFKLNYCPRNNSQTPSVRVACDGPLPGTPQNP